MTATVLPTWARRVVYIGAGGFGAANLLVSSLSVGLLAYDHLQLGGIRSVALALGLDCGAIVAATLWVSAPVGHELRAWGRSVALGLVAASMVGNASDVLADRGHVPAVAVTALALGLALVAPVVSMLLGHLVLLVRATVTPSAAVTPSRPAASRPPKPARPSRPAAVTPAVTPRAVTSPPETVPAPDPAPHAPHLVPAADQAPEDESPDERKRRLAAERAARYRDRQKEKAA